MSKPKITLVRDKNALTAKEYRVKQTVDNMRVEVGERLSKSEVEDILGCRKYQVVIQEK